MNRKRAYSRSILKIFAVAVLCAAAIFIIFSLATNRQYLILKNQENGRLYGVFPADEGSRFSVSFIHSVTQSPVIESYQIENGEIYVTKLQYYSFGAGMPTELEEGLSLSYGEDGSMILSGFHQKTTGMIYVVGMVSDHILAIDGQEYSLRELCGRGSPVTFTLRRLPVFLADWAGSVNKLEGS